MRYNHRLPIPDQTPSTSSSGLLLPCFAHDVTKWKCNGYTFDVQARNTVTFEIHVIDRDNEVLEDVARCQNIGNHRWKVHFRCTTGPMTSRNAWYAPGSNFVKLLTHRLLPVVLLSEITELRQVYPLLLFWHSRSRNILNSF